MGHQEINNLVTSELAKIESNQPRHSIIFRPISDEFHGRFQLIGTDQIDAEVNLISGRNPGTCDSINCEVVVVNPEGLTSTPPGFEIVGEAKVSPSSSLLKSIEPQTPLLITSDLSETLKLKPVEGYPGSELWAVPISKQAVAKKGLTNYLDSLNNTDQLLGLESTRLLIDGPIGKLEETKSQIKVLSNRIISLELTISLIASFSIFVIALASRKSNLSFVKSINRISPNLISKKGFIGSLALIVSVFGTVFGIVAGAVFSLFIYRQINFQYVNLQLLTLIFSTSFLAIISGFIEKSQLRIFLVFLTILFWILFANVLNLDLWLSLIPVVISFVFLVFNEFANRKFSSEIAKNIYLSKSSQFITLGVVSALLISTLFSAVTYLSSLNRNVIDSATFESPTATRITMSSESQPMQHNSFADYKKHADGADVFGVRKLSTTFFVNAANSFPTQLVGVDPKVWNFVPDVSDQTGLNLKKTDTLLPSSNSSLGIDLEGKKTLSVAVSGLNIYTNLGIWVLNDRMESIQIPLSLSNQQLVANLPDNVMNLLGFQITEMSDYKDRRDHAVGEGKNALPAPSGTLSISNLELDGTSVDFSQISNVEYSVINGPIYFSLVEKPQSIPVVVDSKTNTLNQKNNLQLRVTGESYIELQIVGVANNLPTVPMQFALVNDKVLTQYLAAVSPELLHINEVWISRNLSPNLTSDKELYGLTVFSQSELINKFQTPTNAEWSKKALILICLIAFLLLVLVLFFAATEIFKDDQFVGWYASGQSIKHLAKIIDNKIFVLLSYAVLISGILGAWLIRFYVERISYNINGDIAYPKLITHFDIKSQIIVLIIFASITLLIIKFIANRLINQVRQL